MKDVKDLKVKLETPSEDKDVELPEIPSWDRIFGRPTSLGDLDPDAETALNNAEATFLTLGDLAYLDSITTTQITDNAITTPKLAAGSVIASKLSVGTLSAISANLGTITAGDISAVNIDASDITGSDIVGTRIRTSTSGDRVELNDTDDAIRIYDTAGTKRMELIHDTLNFYNENGFNAGLLYATDTGSYEYLFFDISNNSDGSFLFNIDNTGRFIVAEDANVKLYYDASTNEFVFWEDIVSDGGLVDIGTSAADFDDIWCDELHYFTLTARSDERIKKNIKPLQYGLQEVLQLEPISYNFKRRNKKIKEEVADGSKGKLSAKKKKVKTDKLAEKKQKLKDRLDYKTSVVHMGFSAQKVAKIMPELTVNTEPDSEVGSAAIKQNEMTAVLVRAIQELHSEVADIKDKMLQ